MSLWSHIYTIWPCWDILTHDNGDICIVSVCILLFDSLWAQLKFFFKITCALHVYGI